MLSDLHHQRRKRDFFATVIRQTLEPPGRVAAFPDAFNPSLAKIEGGFLLSFRYCPDRAQQSWLSELWVVFLDPSLEPVSEPQKLNTRQREALAAFEAASKDEHGPLAAAFFERVKKLLG